MIEGKMDGIGRFTQEIFTRLSHKHPEIEFHFLFDRPFDEKWNTFKNVKPTVIWPRTVHPILFKYWYNIGVNKYLKKNQVDLFVSPDGFIPKKSFTKTLSVIHDLNFEHLPDKLPGKITHMYRRNFPWFARQSTRIATVSEYSKKDIIKTYGIAEEKIDVVFNGGEQFAIEHNDKVHGPPYFVYIGSIHPRKNIDGLIKAFDSFKQSSNLPHELLIIGKHMWNPSEIMGIHDSLQHKKSIKFLGRLHDKEVAKYLKSAEALVFVSLFEGFGIPVLEAMQLGTSVIASNTTSIPEVAGDAALLVDPTNINEIAQAMNKVASSPDFRQELVEKGKVRSQQFSWDMAAKLMWKSINKALGA